MQGVSLVGWKVWSVCVCWEGGGFNVVTTLKSAATQHQGVNLSPPSELRPLSSEEC